MSLKTRVAFWYLGFLGRGVEIKASSISDMHVPPTAYFDNKLFHFFCIRNGSDDRICITLRNSSFQSLKWHEKPSYVSLTKTATLWKLCMVYKWLITCTNNTFSHSRPGCMNYVSQAQPSFRSKDDRYWIKIFIINLLNHLQMLQLSYLNLSSFNLKPLPHILSLQALVRKKKPTKTLSFL